MDFEKNVPEWNAEGTEPPSSLKNTGFESGYKPPAAYFNWFWHGVSACLTEIREKMKQIRSVADGGTGKSAFANGNYLIGNGTGAISEKTPAEVREHIGAAKKNAAIPVAAATSEDGVIYSATIDGVTELYNGMIITIIPNINSASTTIKLNVNNLGEKMVRLPLSFDNAAMSMPKLETYFSAERPITLQYDAAYLAGDGIWKTLGKQKTSAQDLYGTVPIEGGGTGATTAEEARGKLGITPQNIGALSYEKVLTATFAASGWSAAAPYTQMVTVAEILNTDNPSADIDMSTATADTVEDMQEAYAMLSRIETADGSVTATCLLDKPETDFTVRMKVVR